MQGTPRPSRVPSRKHSQATLTPTLAVYKGTSLPLKNRLVAATAAISYETPRLPPAEHSDELNQHIETDKPMSPDEEQKTHC